LAQVRDIQLQSLECRLSALNLPTLNNGLKQLVEQATQALIGQGFDQQHIQLSGKLMLKYQGTDTALAVSVDPLKPKQIEDLSAIVADFEQQQRQRFGFTSDAQLIIEAIQVEGIGTSERPLTPKTAINKELTEPQPHANRKVYFAQQNWTDTPFYQREQLSPGHTINGPAIIVEPQTTIVIEPHWQLSVNGNNDLVLTKLTQALAQPQAISSNQQAQQNQQVDPIRLELFNNLFMFIAEQMGLVLKNTATSVNIKERLDFSCALFNQRGELVANAPHMPVHLGSMGESVTSIAEQNQGTMQPGDVYLINSPFHGGSHLPDLTVVTPVFNDAGSAIEFFVASRGHHADIGGLTPGSMPPDSSHIDQEGILFDNFLLLRAGQFKQTELLEKLQNHRYPARNCQLNIVDLKAQIAANQKGIEQLRAIQDQFGADVVAAYMDHMIDAAESSVQQALKKLKSGSFCYPMDDGSKIQVAVSITNDKALVDFTGSSPQQSSNFNAPYAVVKAAVLYVFRTLVDKNIPLNAGCLKPIELVVPAGSMLNPKYPAAVVAGNVETSQAITDALYGALQVSAASQGTMNNFTFGDNNYQYYETICGGTGGGLHGDGCDAVQSHMTNSRLTDPEVLEWRFPVTLEQFSIRHGSGGKGLYQGGNGVIRRMRFEQPMNASILSNRRTTAPFGLLGGEDGQPGHNFVTKANGSVVELKACDSHQLEPGDTITIETPGGGAFNKAK
jgi:5-oxoprolinase (ATP-hydrolysing)